MKSITYLRLYLLYLASVLLITGCERPFVAPRVPSLKVISPEFDEVFDTDIVRIQVEATSFRDIDRVLLDNRVMSFVPELNVWEDTLFLSRGLNRFILSAFDVDNVSQYDTLYAVFLVPRVSQEVAPSLPTALGGHSATLLSDSTLLVIGGTPHSSLPAVSSAFELSRGSSMFVTSEGELSQARTGHTATRLYDGNVLIVGGSRIDRPESVVDFIEGVELFDSETRTFRNIPVTAPDPIRRTHHSAFIYPDPNGSTSDAFVYLFGGYGDVRFGSQPVLSVKRDLRIFHLQRDTLRAAGPSIGLLFETISGHSQTLLRESPDQMSADYFIAGTDEPSGSNFNQRVFQLDIRPTSINTSLMLQFQEPRTRHTGSLLFDDTVLLVGGRSVLGQNPLETMELAVLSAKTVLRFPNFVRLQSDHWGHSATKMGQNRILIVGGYGGSGNAYSSGFWLEY